jgi:hypothetical protein
LTEYILAGITFSDFLSPDSLPEYLYLGKSNNDDLLSLKEKLLDVLQTITYDRADGTHHVVGVIQSDTAYKADHNGTAFPIPKRLGLWDDNIDKDATVVELKKAEAMHKARAEDYGIWKAAEDGCKKLLV